MPDWAFALRPDWLREAGALVRRAGLRLILDLNLITSTPTIAAEWARGRVGSRGRGRAPPQVDRCVRSR
jgi:hypothetical protein